MKSRRERKEEERRIVEELGLNTPQKQSDAPKKSYGKDMPEVMHCKRCKTQLDNGVCPVCGYKMYMPMDESKQKRIRLIVGGVCIVAFLILFFIIR